MPKALYEQAHQRVQQRRMTLTEALLEGLQLWLQTPANPRELLSSDESNTVLQQLRDELKGALLDELRHEVSELLASAAEDWPTGGQLLSLALHYFTTRHPEADDLQVCTAAQVLVSHAVMFLSGYPVEEDPRYEQAEAWLLSLAGGVPPAPGEIVALTPPYDDAGRAILPGSDLAAFTRAMVGVIEALVFTSEASARTLAEAFLRQAGDQAAQRAADIFQRCVLGQVLDVDAPVICTDCGAAGLEIWYTGQTWGETLWEACYAARVQTGQARRGEA
jgi:hypothetical protein